MPPKDHPAGSPSAAPKCLLDFDGQQIFTNEFEHHTMHYNGSVIDVIQTAGNIWFNGPDVLTAMGFEPHRSGGQGRRLKRVAPPDIVKIEETPFRFTDGRRNRSSLISPRAVVQFTEGKTQGFNPFKALPFVEWMKECALPDGERPEACSPVRRPERCIEPVFRQVITEVDKNEGGEDLDPRRPIGVYSSVQSEEQIEADEVEFCLCTDERNGLGKCWCGGKGGIRHALPTAFTPYQGDDVIDDEDDGIIAV